MSLTHEWFNCGLCGPAVLCGLCGNNCCNGGYGTLPGGDTCPKCPEAYVYQSLGPPATFKCEPIQEDQGSD